MKTTTTATTKVCTKCGAEKPIEDFRLHKSGYHLGKCYACEKESWKGRTKKTKETAPEPVLEITTKSGQVLQFSMNPIPGGRKVTSKDTDKVIYTTPEVTRDQARTILQKVANVKRETVTATMVK